MQEETSQTVKDRKKKKKDHHRSTLITQLESKYDTILKKENIITEKLKQTKSKKYRQTTSDIKTG